MPFDNLRRMLRPWVFVGAALAVFRPPAVDAADPAAAIKNQFQQQIWHQQQMRMMMSMQRSGEVMINALPAFLRIHAAAGTVEGMGTFTVMGRGFDDKPRLSYVELAGKRYLPKDTDSLRVWDLVGYPKGRNWAFVMAKGPVTGFAYDPVEGVQSLTRTAPDSKGWLEESNWMGRDSLHHVFQDPAAFSMKRRSDLEAAKGDPVMGLRLLNVELPGKPEGNFPALLDHVEKLCKKKKFEEAEGLLAQARGVDAHYFRLHFATGRCREIQGQGPAALEAYRQAIRHAGLDRRFQKDVEKRIVKLESAFPEVRPDSSAGIPRP